MRRHRRPPLPASESEPDVSAFTDTGPHPDVSLPYWQQWRQRSVGREQ